MKLAIVLLCAALFMISDTGMVYCQHVKNQTGEIKGVLIEEKTSRPVVGQTLVLWGYNPEKSKIISISVAGQTPPKAKTDDAGKFSFTSLPAGTYVITPEVERAKVLSIILKTRKPGTIEIMVKAGESVDLGVVRLRRPQ